MIASGVCEVDCVLQLCRLSEYVKAEETGLNSPHVFLASSMLACVMEVTEMGKLVTELYAIDERQAKHMRGVGVAANSPPPKQFNDTEKVAPS